MTRFWWLGGLVVAAAIALLFAFRGAADASTQTSCSRVEGFVNFCLNVPTTTARRDTTVPLVTLPSALADVRVETTVPGPDAIALATSVDRAVARVEALFGRPYSARPRVLVFGTSTSYARGAAELFNYSPETAAYVASAYGGIFDRGTLTIAINWSAGDPGRMEAAIEHELTHLMVHDIAAGRDVPVWLDEGIATVVEQTAPGASGWSADDDLAGDALASSGAIQLRKLTSVGAFHAAYDRFGRALYAYCADAVRTLEQRVGWSGIVEMLAGERDSTLDGDVEASAAARILTSAIDGRGDVTWTLLSGRPNTEFTVAISGGRDYRVTFAIRTDATGMYRGSFGSTAAPGTYTVTADGLSATFSTAR